ncbi:MAG: alkaline phosphatase D family protein [Chitinophagales bacterium]
MKAKLTLLFLLFTLLSTAQNTNIAIIGCHVQSRPAPTFDYLVENVQPKYSIWVGDNVYADTKEDSTHLENQLAILAAKKGFQALKTSSQFFVTWDDHDFGLNNAGGDYPLKEVHKTVHRDFWELEEEIPEDRDGVYYSHITEEENGKTIQFIMLDGRYNRDKPSKRNGTALGEEQWQWLEEELKKEADLRFVVSGYQVLLNRPTRWESWTKIGKEKKKLFQTIKDADAKGVVFITGDQHYVEVLKAKKDKIGYDTYEIMASGINQTEKAGLAHNRVAGPDLTYNSASVIEVQWEDKESKDAHILFTVTNVENGDTTLTYEIPFENIGL